MSFEPLRGLSPRIGPLVRLDSGAVAGSMARSRRSLTKGSAMGLVRPRGLTGLLRSAGDAPVPLQHLQPNGLKGNA